MNKYDKKRLSRMYERVDKIAKQGRLGWEEYKEYLDEIVNDGQFWLFQNLLATKYGINTANTLSLVDAKTQRIYDIIRFNTKSDFQVSLKKIYDTNECYQISKKVYSTVNNTFLGEIYQEPLRSATQSYLVDAVVAVKGSEVLRYDDIDDNLLDRYKHAIEFIVS